MYIRFTNVRLTPAQLKMRSDPKHVKLAVWKLLSIIWDNGARVFAKELAYRVLVETGESAGSIEPLGRFLSITLNFKSPTSTGKKLPSRDLLTGKVIKGEYRTFSNGQSKGTKAFNFNYGSPDNAVFNFIFSIQVYQFALHDSGRAKYQVASAINATGIATEMMLDYVKVEMRRRLPKAINQWLTTGQVKEAHF